MRKLFILSAFIGLLSLTSCKWVSTTDSVSMQPEINSNLVGMTADAVLEALGQPSSIEVDSSSLELIRITKMHFADKVTLQWYTNYNELYQCDEPYVDVYMKNGKVYSAKTNIVKPVIPKKEKILSIVKIATYSGVLLLVVVICCVTLLLAKKRTLTEINDRLAVLVNAENRNDKTINTLQTKARFLEKETLIVKDRLTKLERRTSSVERALEDTTEHEEDDKLVRVSPEALAKIKNMSREELEELFARKISEFGFSVRTYNCLRAADIEYLGQLCTYRRRELSRFRNLGRRSLLEIDALFEKLGLAYGMNLSGFGYDGNKKPVFPDKDEKKETVEEQNKETEETETGSVKD